MIFHVKAAQNFAAERYGIDFDKNCPHDGFLKIVCGTL